MIGLRLRQHEETKKQVTLTEAIQSKIDQRLIKLGEKLMRKNEENDIVVRC